MFTAFAAPGLTRAAFCAFAAAHGFRLASDAPATGSRRVTIVVCDGAEALFATDASACVAVVRVNPAAVSLQQALAPELTAFGAFVEAGQAIRGRIAQLRFMHDLAFLLTLSNDDEKPVGLAAAFAALDSDDEIVAGAAAKALMRFPTEQVAAAFARSARPEFRARAEHVRATLQKVADGTLTDEPTTDYETLIDRARAGVEAGQWPRVIAATTAIFAQDLYSGDVAALTFRGLAHEALGEVVLALGILGAAELEATAIPGEPGSREAALLPQLVAARAGVDAVVRALPVAEREAAAPAVIAWFDALRDPYGPRLRSGAAMALLGLLPSIEAKLLFHVVRHNKNLDSYQQLNALVPDSRAVHYRIGLLLATGEPAQPVESAAMLRRARAATAQSDAARYIDALDAVSNEQIDEAILDAIYSAQRYDEAAALGKELTAQYPNAAVAWELWPDALLFAGRIAEAAVAYGEALVALDSIFDTEAGGDRRFGRDPRAGLHFNRCCALAKLGRPDAAVDELRRAVRRAPKWIASAKTDDWLEPLRDRKDFQAIIAGDAAALVLPEELDPTFVAALIARANYLDYTQGQPAEALKVARRAAELAAASGQPALQVSTIEQVGRLLLSSGDAEGGRAELERAVAMAASAEVPISQRAEVVHFLGHAYRMLEAWDEAARCYADALALRKTVHGAEGCLVAKSHADLAVLAQAKGETPEVILGHLHDGAAVLATFLASPAAAGPEHLDARNEALIDLGTVRTNESRIHIATGNDGAAVQAGHQSLDAFEEAVRGGDKVRPALLEHELERYTQAANASSTHGSAFFALHDRAEVILVPGPRAERIERGYWRRWRSLANVAESQGMTGGDFAGLMAGALNNDLPGNVAQIPLFRGFASEMSQRFDRNQGFMTLLPMALSAASERGDVMAMLRDLEELCVSSL